MILDHSVPNLELITFVVRLPYCCKTAVKQLLGIQGDFLLYHIPCCTIAFAKQKWKKPSPAAEIHKLHPAALLGETSVAQNAIEFTFQVAIFSGWIRA